MWLGPFTRAEAAPVTPAARFRPMQHHLTGSKKKARIKEREQRKSRAFLKRLARIYELSRCIKNEAELEHILNQVPDEDTRRETRKLIEPFLLFQLGGQADADKQADPELVQQVAEIAANAGPERRIILAGGAELVH